MVEASGILACFKGAVDDPRSPSGLRHRIGPLLALCAAATLCGARGWTEMHEWIRSLSPAMPGRFRCRKIDGVHERPSIYCIRNIMIKAGPDQPARATARFCQEHGWDQEEGIAVDAGRSAARSTTTDARRACPGPAAMAPPRRLLKKNCPDHR